MHVLDYYFSKKNNYAFSNKNYKLEKLVIKKTLFYDDISTSTLRAMRAQTYCTDYTDFFEAELFYKLMSKIFLWLSFAMKKKLIQVLLQLLNKNMI